MKILTGRQIREADLYTIDREPIPSIELMERASVRMADRIAARFGPCNPLFFVFAGKGNNGGDGAALARLLSDKGYDCALCSIYDPEEGSEEFRINYSRLPDRVARTRFDPAHPPALPARAVVIDALLGSGITGPARGIVEAAIASINRLGLPTASIDIPSGMSTEFGNAGRPIVRAGLTLTLQFPKLSLLLPEAGNHGGEMDIVDIGLSPAFIEQARSDFYYTTPQEAERLIPARNAFDHKGSYGHALIIAGSSGMTGAALLSVSAALRSGCGLVTGHLPASAQPAVNAVCPSALTSLGGGDCFTRMPESLHKYTAVGIGPGLGQGPETVRAVDELLSRYRYPMVIDADALNILAAHPHLTELLPPGSILTPHPGELRRLVGKWSGDEEKLRLAREFSASTRTVLVVKGAYTAVITPEGRVCFNPTGNPGMAKGGSGDVLTGLLTGLLAKGMAPEEASVAGVYLHGLAGDRARDRFGIESMNASDLLSCLRF